MNAAQQLEAAGRLDAALNAVGLVVERPRSDGGNVRGWEEVSAAEILGRLVASSRWRVRMRDGEERADVEALRLLR